MEREKKSECKEKQAHDEYKVESEGKREIGKEKGRERDNKNGDIPVHPDPNYIHILTHVVFRQLQTTCPFIITSRQGAFAQTI